MIAATESPPVISYAAPLLASGGGDRERYVFVDALRAIAAMMVVFRHLYTSTPFYETLNTILPRWMQIAAIDGLWGVHIFFVLSGFVIAHSLRNLVASPRSVGRFIVRRQLRLDPLYWFMVFVTVFELGVRHWLATRHGAVKDWGVPNGPAILANLFYLHRILRVREVCATAWTLCIEVQFYLVFIVCLATGQFVNRRLLGRAPGQKNLSVVSVILVIGLGLASLTVLNVSINPPDELVGWSPWFTAFWYYFAAGALACWAVQGRIPSWVYVAFGTLFLGLGAYWQSGGMLTGGLTATALFLVGKAGHLTDWLAQRPLQFLGRISYSLYMTHMSVVIWIMRGGFKLTHENRGAAVVWSIFAIAASIAAAYGTYLLIERPSLRFASQFSRKPAAGDPSTEPAAPPAGEVSGFAEDPVLPGDAALSASPA